MCGIAGIIGSRAADQVAPLNRMSTALAHRGPDADGTFTSRAGTCALAHRRLSILDLSVAANQPMHDPSGRYTLVYNGECYNHLKLRERLRGHWLFRTTTDTETVLAWLITHGRTGLADLAGMFALGLWDEA